MYVVSAFIADAPQPPNEVGVSEKPCKLPLQFPVILHVVPLVPEGSVTLHVSVGTPPEITDGVIAENELMTGTAAVEGVVHTLFTTVCPEGQTTVKGWLTPLN